MGNTSPNPINDDVRLEIFLDWEECNGYVGKQGIDQFCYAKRITLNELIDIVREFEGD